MNGRWRLCVALTFLLAAGGVAPAAAPVVDYLYPAGGQQGTTVAVAAGGKFDRWPVQAWADGSGLKLTAGKDKGQLSIEIAKDAPPGPRLLRLYDAEGASALRVFLVGTRREIAEVEPNDEASKATAAGDLPVTVNGRLEKPGDVDSFAVKLEAGQCLTAVVEGRRLGSPLDPLLHLDDAAGNPVEFCHDGMGLDPLLVHRAERTGTYVLRLAGFKHPPAAEVRLTGEAADVYRLHLGVGPPVRYSMPSGARRGAKGKVQLVRWHIGRDEAPVTLEVDATGARAGEESLLVPCGDETFRIELGEGPELTEGEGGTARSAPFAVTGRIEQPGEDDAFPFTAKKGERLVVAVGAAALASPMDALVRLEDAQGKQLASNDDGAGAAGDARLEWSAPEDGTYRVVVGDLYRRGGDACVYRLSVTSPAPTVGAKVDADEYRVAAGKSVALKASVTRAGGYGGPLVVVATGLPPGVTATSAEVPEKGGEVTLTLTAAADAKPAGGTFRITVLSPDRDRPAAWAATAGLRKEAGQELIEQTDAPWLTVLPAG